MKKEFLFCIAALFFCQSCAYQNAQGAKKEPDPSVFYTNDRKIQDPSLQEVELETARNMVKHYKDKETKKDKGGYLQFDPVELQQLLAEPNIVDVKLVNAAYLESDTDNDKRNTATILICVRQSAGATVVKYYSSSKICPPPDGNCSPEL